MKCTFALLASLVLVTGCSQNPMGPSPLVSPSLTSAFQPGPVVPSTVPRLPLPVPVVVVLEPVPELVPILQPLTPIPVAEELPPEVPLPCGPAGCHSESQPVMPIPVPGALSPCPDDPLCGVVQPGVKP